MKGMAYVLALCGVAALISTGCQSRGTSGATDTGTGKLVKLKLPNMT